MMRRPHDGVLGWGRFIGVRRRGAFQVSVCRGFRPLSEHQWGVWHCQKCEADVIIIWTEKMTKVQSLHKEPRTPQPQWPRASLSLMETWMPFVFTNGP